MFGFKKNKECVLYSPVNGKTISLEEVPDKMFASKMMGDGIAFELNDVNLYAPCDGELTMVAHTFHAYGFKARNGAEILIHVGLDTVNLNGQGFICVKEKGSKVSVGELIAKVDLDFMKEKGINLITPMVITNSADYKFHCIEPNKVVHAKDDKVIYFE